MNLYIRLLITLLKSLLASPLDYKNPSLIQKRRVLLNDLDLNKHMNNGRYLTMLDLANIELFVRLGFIPVLSRLKAHVVSGGSIITYRKQLKLWEKYKIHLTYVGSTETWHIMEFKFLNKQGKICAKGLLKGAFVRKSYGILSTKEVLDTYQDIHQKEIVIPNLPDYVQSWLKSEEQHFNNKSLDLY